MAEFEEQKKFWHIFYSPLVFMILLVVFLFMARAMWKVYEHEKLSERDLGRIESELIVVNQRAEVLKSQVDVFETPRGVEDEIRSKFNVTKAGEKVAVIVNSVDAVSTTTITLKKSWWQNILDTFGL